MFSSKVGFFITPNIPIIEASSTQTINKTQTSITLNYSVTSPSSVPVDSVVLMVNPDSTSPLKYTNTSVTTYKFDLTGLTAGTTYTYQYYGTNVNGNGPTSPKYTFSTLALTVPTAPTNLVGTVTTLTNIDLTWSAPLVDGGTPITGYVISYYTSTNSTPVTIQSNTTTTYSLTGLSYNTSYYISVKAVNRVGSSVGSNQITVLTGADPATPAIGEVSFTSAGNYSWVCPSGVNYVSVVCVGGGGGPGGNYGGGGGGGALAYGNKIPVVAGATYTVKVGFLAGGPGSSNSTSTYAGDSWFGASSQIYVLAGGGGNGVAGSSWNAGGGGGAGGYVSGTASAGAGGYPSGLGTKYSGGTGGTPNRNIGIYYSGGSGGGSAAFGLSVNSPSYAGTSGQNGGGGGGSSGYSGGGRGGGVGIRGQGTSGAGGASTPSSGKGSVGFGGSGIGATPAYYGGGGATNSTGLGGAVRIIWPGENRAFPSTGADVYP